MGSRRPRADAVRNRQRVVDAAVEVFAERGLGATMSDVADRAQVGNATVFRNFPTRADLLSELATRWLDDWAAEAAGLLARDPQEDSLRVLIAGVFERFRRDRLALDILRAGDVDQQMFEARTEVERLFTRALRRGIDARIVDPTVSYADLSVLVLGIASRLSEAGEDGEVAWRRMADFTWSAIRHRDR